MNLSCLWISSSHRTVLHVNKLMSLTELPSHEDALTADDGNMLDELQNTSRTPSRSQTFYIARASQSTDERGELEWLKRLNVHVGAPKTMSLWIWLDRLSIPGKDLKKRDNARRSVLCYSQVRV